MPSTSYLFFFFNDTATTEIYTLSLHDALPILNIEDTAEVVQFDPHKLTVVHRWHIAPCEEPSGLAMDRSEEHTSELQSQSNLVCRLLLEKKKTIRRSPTYAGRPSIPIGDNHST